jgi:hypothetical protein
MSPTLNARPLSAPPGVAPRSRTHAGVPTPGCSGLADAKTGTEGLR